MKKSNKYKLDNQGIALIYVLVVCALVSSMLAILLVFSSRVNQNINLMEAQERSVYKAEEIFEYLKGTLSHDLYDAASYSLMVELSSFNIPGADSYQDVLLDRLKKTWKKRANSISEGDKLTAAFKEYVKSQMILKGENEDTIEKYVGSICSVDGYTIIDNHDFVIVGIKICVDEQSNAFYYKADITYDYPNYYFMDPKYTEYGSNRFLQEYKTPYFEEEMSVINITRCEG